MNRDSNVDRILDTWFTEGPTNLPDRTVAAIAEQLDDVHQRRPLGLPMRLSMPRFFPALAGATVVVLVVVLALGVYFNGPGIGVTPSPTPSATPASPDVFTEIAPGEMVEIPDWPLNERSTPPSVWTGTELIVWGDGIYGSADDGAAFNLANGTWRVLAAAPLSPRSESAVAWTGTEMIVWGGRVENSFFYDGAAYNPLTDTWRLLPFPGFSGKDPSMLWTGREAVVFGVKGDSETSGEYIGAAAYNPVADTWRTLVNSPNSVRLGSGPWWAGDSIVVADVGYDLDTMARYDLAADRWTMLDVGASAAVVGVPGADGNVSTFVNLPSETGAPTRLIDTTGSLLAELPAFPGDPGVFGDVVGASGLWVGEEAVFEIWNDGPDSQPEQIWALNPGTQTWHRLDTETAFPRIDSSVRVAGDLLLFWNRPDDVYRGMPRVCCVAPPSKGGSIYRVGTAVPPEVP
ncbi:MAG: hypothetical protein ABI725_06615 [Chloroflexota bacterium]